ncbi:hypothetical protein FHG87_022751 [Trinorchestia longiramus]|nr:hypothetical protein FHG87_022751 [Trinorchestia longiramus]
MKLENGQNLQDHLKVCVELFEELAIIGDAMEEEERVIILLSSVPDRFSTLVTALEAHEKIPAWEVVTERLLNEERRQQGGLGTSDSSEKIASNVDCDSWIVDSGATQHMCNKQSEFSSYSDPSSPVRVEIGDDRALKGIGIGDVRLKITLPNMQIWRMGIGVMQTKNEVFLEQSAYTKALLSRFGTDKANSAATPVDINADLVTTSDEVEECDKDLYQSAVGSLLY